MNDFSTQYPPLDYFGRSLYKGDRVAIVCQTNLESGTLVDITGIGKPKATIHFDDGRLWKISLGDRPTWRKQPRDLLWHSSRIINLRYIDES